MVSFLRETRLVHSISHYLHLSHQQDKGTINRRGNREKTIPSAVQARETANRNGPRAARLTRPRGGGGVARLASGAVAELGLNASGLAFRAIGVKQPEGNPRGTVACLQVGLGNPSTVSQLPLYVVWIALEVWRLGGAAFTLCKKNQGFKSPNHLFGELLLAVPVLRLV